MRTCLILIALLLLATSCTKTIQEARAPIAVQALACHSE